MGNYAEHGGCNRVTMAGQGTRKGCHYRIYLGIPFTEGYKFRNYSAPVDQSQTTQSIKPHHRGTQRYTEENLNLIYV